MGPDLATPADLRAWHSQRNYDPGADRASSRVGETLVAMQGVIDAGAAERQALTISAQTQGRDRRRACRGPDRPPSMGWPCRSRRDRIDQLERHVFGKRSERQATPAGRRGSGVAAVAEEERKAERNRCPGARAKRRCVAHQDVVLPLDPQLPPGRALPPQGSVIYEWRRGELVRLLVQREQRVLPTADRDGTTAAPGDRRGHLTLHAKVAVTKCLDGMPCGGWNGPLNGGARPCRSRSSAPCSTAAR